MKQIHLHAAAGLAVLALLATLATPAAATHGGDHTIELYGTATYVDGTDVASTETVYLVTPDGDGTYTTLDSTTLPSDGTIANQSREAGTPLNISVANGTELQLHLGSVGGTAATFPTSDQLTELTNESQTVHADAVFNESDEIDADHSATLDADGTELAQWDGTDYVATDTEDDTTDTTDDADDESYWSWPSNDTDDSDDDSGPVFAIWTDDSADDSEDGWSFSIEWLTDRGDPTEDTNSTSSEGIFDGLLDGLNTTR